ncbi:hypothetical protein THAOC_13144 [Thalassiosira oceanica]|uniref:Uncharacterized protein n=1 Tax=Thalassiosira oceanica TaxID=159749 RepID=K0SY64_THAOC|nr:hypothetical protein THAOC_13144 [Thalassiosira oceanica]|eukprot:EJK65956.1 hypothetical protein THAOC_13144 [Thalassiosira oceanica]
MNNGIVNPRRQPNVDTPTASSAEIERLFIVLSEIDRLSRASENEVIESGILHGTPQRFIACELRVELQKEVDRLLTEQILLEERDGASATSSPTGKRIANSEDLCSTAHNEQRGTSYSVLSKRREQLFQELRRLGKLDVATVQSSVARSAARIGGDCIFDKQDLMKEMADEMTNIDSKLKLCTIDKELQWCYASTEASPSIRSVHGYATSTKSAKEAIIVLERERDKHIARIAALETIDGILEWMLEGWWFGERDTKRDSRHLEGGDTAAFDRRGSVMDRATDVQRAVIAPASATYRREDICKVETNIKYGLFCMTFMYFRALHQLKKDKSSWNGDLASLRDNGPVSEERQQMVHEQANAEIRRNKIKYAMERALIGEKRKEHRLEQERLDAIKTRHWENRRATERQRLAMTVQRIYRGHLGRKATRLRSTEVKSAEATLKIRNECAVDISRVWRGYCSRKDAKYLRDELAKFMFAIRLEEAEDEEEEYLSSVRRKRSYNWRRKS